MAAMGMPRAYGGWMLEPDATDRMRALLLDLRAEASARADALAATLAELTADRSGSNDDDEHDPEGVTLSSEWSRLTGLAEGASAELDQIDDALARVDTGHYGVCVDCGNPIPVERLEVRPFAERCVTCAAKRA